MIIVNVCTLRCYTNEHQDAVTELQNSMSGEYVNGSVKPANDVQNEHKCFYKLCNN